MSDESEPLTAVAKAVEETAKTGRALIEPGTKLAEYVARMLGTIPEDVIGFLIGDPLHELRQHTLTGILGAVFEKLHRRGVEKARPVRPGPGKEAFEAASLETDPTLQDMWANLLANAMDPDNCVSLQQVFIDTLRKFELHDVLFFQHLGTNLSKEGVTQQATYFTYGGLADHFDLRETQAELSARHLRKLDCIKPARHIQGDAIDDGFELSTLGIELYLACTGDAPN